MSAARSGPQGAALPAPERLRQSCAAGGVIDGRDAARLPGDKLGAVRARAGIVLAFLLLSGCGSSGGSASEASSRQQFIAQANAICAHAAAQAAGLTSGGKLKPESLAAAANLLKKTEAELAALKPPAASAAGFRQFLALASSETRLVSALAGALQARNLRAARSWAGKLQSKASNEAAAKIGLTTCAEETG